MTAAADNAPSREAQDGSAERTDRRRAEAELRAVKERQEFIFFLAQRQRVIEQPDEIMRMAVRTLGQRLNADRVGFYRVVDSGVFECGPCWVAGPLPPLSGRMRSAVFGAEFNRRVEAGLSIVFEDSRTDVRLQDAAYVKMGVLSGVNAPLVRAGRWRASLYIHNAQPRIWTSEEVVLIEEIAALTWDAVERTEASLSLRELNASLEKRVLERTSELAAANRQLLAQIEEREKVETTLRQMQRLEAVGQLTSGVAHDFNNLLTIVLGNVGFLEREFKRAGLNGKMIERVGYMRTAAERGATLTAQLLAFSRRQRLEARPIDLNETVSGMRDLLQSSMGGAVRLEIVQQGALWPALVDPTQIELVILNLAINARDAMQVGGSLTVETANVTLGDPRRTEEAPAGQYVMVSVADTGSGMTEEVRSHAFEPFFTTKPIGKGSGLGLAQVYGFAKQSGGGIRIDTDLGEGTTVRVFLPRAMTAATAAVEASPDYAVQGVIPGRSRRVLLVDDDSAVREVTASMLHDLGCSVVEAGSGGAALDIIGRDPEPFDLMVLDYAMPGMNGTEVARAIGERKPNLPVLFVTGYADLSALREMGEDRIVQKPFRNEELSEKVRRLIGDAPAPNVVAIRR